MSADLVPSVSVLALGGTIASTGAGAGVTPTLTADQLVESVPGLADVARIQADTFRQVPSPELTLVDLVGARARDRGRITQTRRISGEGRISGERRIADTGVVVRRARTRSRRPPSCSTCSGRRRAGRRHRRDAQPDAGRGRRPGEPARRDDGRGGSATPRHCGALVVLNDEIHAARFVRKAHSRNTATFVLAGHRADRPARRRRRRLRRRRAASRSAAHAGRGRRHGAGDRAASSATRAICSAASTAVRGLVVEDRRWARHRTGSPSG